MVFAGFAVLVAIGLFAVVGFALGAVFCYVGVTRKDGKCAWGMITARNKKGVIKIRLSGKTRALYEGHLRLMDGIKRDIKAGFSEDKTKLHEHMHEFFKLLVGEYGAMSLLAWYDNNYDAAWAAVYPSYEKRILPRLRKMYAEANKA